MSDSPDNQEQTPSLRGDAAWRDAKDRVAERNAAATKAGKAEREEFERAKEAQRQGAESREMARFLASRDKS
jgi:hypothetical protein